MTFYYMKERPYMADDQNETTNSMTRRSLLKLGAELCMAGSLALLAGCGTSPATSEAGAATAQTGGTATPVADQEYVEVLALINLPYFVDHKAGLETAGRELGVKTRFIGPAEYDITAMINTMEQVIAQRVAGLLVVGFDDALTPAINKAVAAGIPTVTVDADVASSRRLSFLGTGNFGAGVQGARVLAAAIGATGKVIIVTKTGQSNLEERIAGYRAELAKFPNIKIIQVVNDDSDSTKAAAAVSAVLQTTPDLAGIACVEAAGGVGAATAIKEARKVGQVKIVSMDRDDGTLDFIKDGVIEASIAQKTALMTYLGTKLLFGLKNNPLSIVKDNAAANVVPLPASVDTGTEVITKSNVAAWYH